MTKTLDNLQFIEYQEAPNLGIAGFIDVETTGLSPAYEEIVELAIILFSFNRHTGQIVGIVDEYCELREPGKPIPRSASKVHGIYDKDVKGKSLDEQKITEMVAQAEFLVAHNAPFDRGFVNQLFDCCCNKTWLCSMRGINWRRKGFQSMALQKLLAAHGINVSRAHRAIDDAKASLLLLSLASEEGACYFSELLAKVSKDKKSYGV